LEAAGGVSLHDIASRLLDSIDADKVVAATPPPVTEKAIEATGRQMREAALRLLADGPKLRKLLVDLKTQSELYIDELTPDAVISTGFDENAAKATVARFQEFLEQNQDELTALTLLYGKPARSARLTYESLEALRQALARPPWMLEPISIWTAYRRLSAGQTTANPGRVLTDIVVLVRYALGKSDTLQPLSAAMAGRFNLWLGREQTAGRNYTPEQIGWLEAIRDHLAANIDLSLRDLQEQPGFVERGGVIAARRAFGDRLNAIVEELPKALVA
jgi:type I restriction enzyme R subunit